MKAIRTIGDLKPAKRNARSHTRRNLDMTEASLKEFGAARSIDIDAYGDPWAIWAAIAPRIQQKTAIFITFGHMNFGGGKTGAAGMSEFIRTQNGIPGDWNIPQSADLFRFLGRRYFMASMCKLNASLALVVDHERVSYYGALVHGKTR